MRISYEKTFFLYPLAHLLYNNIEKYVRGFMKKEKIIVKTDGRNRITIPKGMAKGSGVLYRIYEEDGKIILAPVLEVPKEDMWLFDPKNKKIVDELKEALLEKAEIDLGSFKNHLKKK